MIDISPSAYAFITPYAATDTPIIASAIIFAITLQLLFAIADYTMPFFIFTIDFRYFAILR
jgi:hypothetical protein